MNNEDEAKKEKSELEIIEVQIHELLKSKNINAKKYFGELENPKNFKYELTTLPLILSDFIGSKPIDILREECKFNLYEIHVAYSKNENTRAAKHYELYSLQKTIKKILHLKSFENSEPIKMGKLEKIFDANISTGYLTVYKQEFSIIIKEGVEL